MLDMRINRRTFTVGTGIVLASLKGQSGTAHESDIYTFAFLGLDIHTGNGSQRSDTIMFSRLDLNSGMVRTLSIPRDLYVEIPGLGHDKINAAYQRGLEADPELKWQSGAASSLTTIAHNFGVECDGVVILELERMGEAIDAVGGLEVDNPYYLTHVFSDGRTRHYPAGVNRLNGEEAAFFIRTRQQDGDGGRVMRQHLVLTALLEKLQQPEYLLRIPSLIEQLSDIVHTDIPLDVQLQLIEALPSISRENLAFTNIEEFLWSGYTEGGAWIYQADWSTLPQYVRSWLNGEIE